MKFRLSALALLALFTLSASAQDMDDAPPPPAPNPDTVKFVAYGEPLLAFVHAEIVDGTGAAPRYDQTLIVRDGRIAALGPASRIPIPRGATVIDARHKTLLPGFVMVHEHLFYPSGPIYAALPVSFSRLYLAGGTTTARTGGSLEPYADINLEREIAQGKEIGPDLDVTGPYLNGEANPFLQMHSLAGPEDATRMVNFWADAGATSFKAYINITRAELKAAIEAAHARGLKITGHLCSVTYREAADLGIDNLEHGFAVMTDFFPGKQPDICPPHSQQAIANVDIDSPEVKSLIDLLVKKHVALTSTLTVLETFTPGRPKAPEAALDLLLPPLRDAYEQSWSNTGTNPNTRPYTVIFPKLMKLEKMFFDAGGTLLAGTDPTGYGGVIPGFSAKREVELLVEAGFTFPQALKIATLNGAVFLGRAASVGSLVVGKRADIAVIDGDPMRDAMALEHMPLVFKAGIGYQTDMIFASLRGKVGLY